MTTENKYFRELTLNLQRASFTVDPEADNLLLVELDGERLCVATEGGSIRYRKEDVASEARTTALDKVTDIVGVTAGYLRQMEAAPILKASGLSEEFKQLADFNGSVLAGQETKYGVQMVTWDWAYNKCESRVEKKKGRQTAQKSRECKYVANKSHKALLRCLRQ